MKEKRIIEQSKDFMNTTITIKVVQDDQTTVQILDTINEAFGEFDRIVKKYTRFNEESELSNLNRMSGEWVSVSHEFFHLIEQMLEFALKTNYAFDPTVIDFLETYGYDKNYDFSKLNNKQLNKFVEKTALTRSHVNEIELDKKQKKVKLKRNQRLDLGGIGKGYAIDCSFKKIVKISNNFLISAGGDIRASGLNHKQKVWIVDLKTKDKTYGQIELDNAALASSGNWARRVKQFHHIINPKTGKPVESEFNTVFVKAPTATIADAWATALFVNPKLKATKQPLEVFFV